MANIERLKDVISYLKANGLIHNQQDFVDKIGDNRSTVSSYLNGTRTFSNKFANKIAATFPQISADWLVYGKGEMIIDIPIPNNESDLSKLIDSNASLAASVAKLAETNSRLADKVLELSSNARGAVVRMDENAECAVAK